VEAAEDCIGVRGRGLWLVFGLFIPFAKLLGLL
jgi:hypothetical protein